MAANGDWDPPTNTLRPSTDSLITVRVVKSFAYRTCRNLVLDHLNLEETTVGDLKARCMEDIKTKPGWKPYRTVTFDTMKIYTRAHGAKTTNLIINLDHDDWFLDDDSATLASVGLENEAEISFFVRSDYDAFKANPEQKW